MVSRSAGFLALENLSDILNVVNQHSPFLDDRRSSYESGSAMKFDAIAVMAIGHVLLVPRMEL